MALPLVVERRHRPAPVPAPYRGVVPCGCDEGWTFELVRGRSYYEDGKLVPVRCKDCAGNSVHTVYVIPNSPALGYDQRPGFLVVLSTARETHLGWAPTSERAMVAAFEWSNPVDPVGDRVVLDAMGVRP